MTGILTRVKPETVLLRRHNGEYISPETMRNARRALREASIPRPYSEELEKLFVTFRRLTRCQIDGRKISYKAYWRYAYRWHLLWYDPDKLSAL